MRIGCRADITESLPYAKTLGWGGTDEKQNPQMMHIIYCLTSIWHIHTFESLKGMYLAHWADTFNIRNSRELSGFWQRRFDW